jgi:Flp pilus assembly pilin Flp
MVPSRTFGWGGYIGYITFLPGAALQTTLWIKELHMKTLFSWFVKDESGPTAIENALIAVGISVLIIAAVKLVWTTFPAPSTTPQLTPAEQACLAHCDANGSGPKPEPFRLLQPRRADDPME